MGVRCPPFGDPHEDSQGNETFSHPVARFRFPSGGGWGRGRNVSQTKDNQNNQVM